MEIAIISSLSPLQTMMQTKQKNISNCYILRVPTQKKIRYDQPVGLPWCAIHESQL